VEDKIMQITKEERCINRPKKENNVYVALTPLGIGKVGYRQFTAFSNQLL
jgi:hypothetical protein